MDRENRARILEGLTAVITFDKVVVRYGDVTVLPEYDLTVEEGEFFTLLGPSGCGKSTALRTLAGFVTPHSGEVHVAGQNVTHLPSHRRQIGMVFQNYALFPSLSVRDNMAFGLKATGVSASERDERVRSIARDVDLSEAILDKGIAELSGGQQQRVAIARALVLRPRILLLDEPLSNLDAKLRGQLRGQLKELQTQFGITTVYVTHDQDEALALSDRIAVMNGGRIEQVGTPNQVYTRSSTEFVCNFVGESNRLSTDMIDALRAGGAQHLDPSKPSYVRVEKVALTPASEARLLHETMRGEIRSRSYHGLYSSYHIDTAGGPLRSIVPESAGRVFDKGDVVDIDVDARDVLQYEDAA
ncbi:MULTISPECIES: ABC transporter ATP-binding protein [unclassified Rhodococcus (in: high G+C Gram-positive bacteria)]|uniref:ABC transporter ATP-binding protein n=1 Tax=unclassified Rhodococcus (in: high G+C Gram-positive bacteria) TaxID=192944 RepID=UPI0019106E70|nr:MULTISPECIES: ABC transporter ATP-binding protein [unclassified Rhodococcus (in: high G+C Gram-positive bacteria)]MDI9932642.1 ABC transporter ATP-binding protein [Rhodococcus sp. IEGM 1354]